MLPQWPHDPPSWLNKEICKWLSIIQYNGNESGFILDFPKQYPGGGNITYVRSILETYKGFKSKFGRKGKLLLSGEETELNYRLKDAGYPIWFCPRAIVHHHIPSDRLLKSYFRSRSYWTGRSAALLDFEVSQGNYQITFIRRIISRLTINLLRALFFSILKRNNPFEIEVYICEVFGYVSQGLVFANKK